MSLDDWASIGSIVNVALVIISVGIIWYELRQNNKLTRAANVHALAELASPFNLQLIQDPEMAKMWLKGKEQFNTWDEVKQFRYQALITWWLILHENIYYQHRNGLIERSAYDSWDRDLVHFVREQNLEQLWTGMRDSFQADFAGHVSQLIQATKTS